jgi:hypothetical protein
MMQDELFDREYQAGRAALNEGISELLTGIGRTFKVMSAIQFNAPWHRDARRQCGPAI